MSVYTLQELDFHIFSLPFLCRVPVFSGARASSGTGKLTDGHKLSLLNLVVWPSVYFLPSFELTTDYYFLIIGSLVGGGSNEGLSSSNLQARTSFPFLKINVLGGGRGYLDVQEPSKEKWVMVPGLKVGPAANFFHNLPHPLLPGHQFLSLQELLPSSFSFFSFGSS